MLGLSANAREAGRWPDGRPFYAMKLVSGRSLRELIGERTTVDVVWHLGFETRPAEIVTAFVRCRVPYRLVETRLEPATPACE